MLEVTRAKNICDLKFSQFHLQNLSNNVNNISITSFQEILISEFTMVLSRAIWTSPFLATMQHLFCLGEQVRIGIGYGCHENQTLTLEGVGFSSILSWHHPN